MTKADNVREYALSLKGNPYKLGEEFWYVVGTEQTASDDDGDCSGLVYATFRKAGVLLKGKEFPRLTAQGYYNLAAKITQPTKPGDLGFLAYPSGAIHHVFVYVGNDQIAEAGDGTGKVGVHTVAHENARGAIWGRLDTDIGELTEEDDMGMTSEQITALLAGVVHTDKSAKQNGYKLAALGRYLVGDYAGAVQLEKDFQSAWPNERGMFPLGMTVAEMKAAAEG